MPLGKQRGFHFCILVLQLPCSVGASDTKDYIEMILGRLDEREGISDDS